MAPAAAAAAEPEAAEVEAEPEAPEAAEAPEAPEVPAEPEARRTLVAVLFLATGGAEAGLADNLTEVLLASVASAGHFTIVGREQFGAALGFGTEEQTLACAEDPVCLGRIATMAGAEEVVLGSLGHRAGRYLVNLSRIDVRRARAVHRVFRSTPDEVGPLIGAVTEAARELMRPPPGAARVTVNVPEAVLLIDDEEVSPDPDGVIRGLEPGRHLLVVQAEGYGEVRRHFDVDRGAVADLAVSLSRVEVRVVESSAPWYTRWWVWTLVGVAAAGAGAATAAVLLTEPAETASGSLGTMTAP